MGHQVWVQIQAVLTTIVWSGIGSAIILKVVDIIIGLRVRPEVESEGLDIVEHGERAYQRLIETGRRLRAPASCRMVVHAGPECVSPPVPPPKTDRVPRSAGAPPCRDAADSGERAADG